jgi:hypothetical protein
MFTRDNTAGLTDDQLLMLNKTADVLRAEYGCSRVDDSMIEMALSACWRSGGQRDLVEHGTEMLQCKRLEVTRH